MKEHSGAAALIMAGGWEGHEPLKIAERFAAFLRGEGFTVRIEQSTDVLDDLSLLQSLDLFVPVWTAGPAFPYAHFEKVAEAVGGGTGLAGCHGGMCDAFRHNILWQFITGANWVSHPGGDGVPYRVNIVSKSNPLTEGLSDFDVSSEQYYLHVDPANEVLATTRFPTVKWYHAANGEVDVPQVWTRRWGYGRVFYNALGHHDAVFDEAPAAWTLMRRGLLWAAEGKRIAREQGLSADDWKSTRGMY
ncbi:MAG: ThuA domain-containing protein [Treponema sp.]|jgi:type 1 glutamine amidotransferase|nr:ThuA domain-containing protein [Treponema sp.]